MKTYTTIFNNFVDNLDLEYNHPTTITCEITMIPEEVIETIGINTAKKLGINPEEYELDELVLEENDDSVVVENSDKYGYGEPRTMCTIELDLYPNAEIADAHSEDGMVLYTNAIAAFEPESECQSVIDAYAYGETNKTFYSPGILLNVTLNEDLEGEDFLWAIKEELFKQIRLAIKMAKMFMTRKFKNKSNTFIGIPCTSELHIELANEILPNRNVKIEGIIDNVLNVSKLKNEKL